MFHYFVISSKTHQKNLTYCIFFVEDSGQVLVWKCLFSGKGLLFTFIFNICYLNTELTKHWLYFASRIDVKSSNSLIPILKRQFFFIPRGESCEVRGSILNCCWLKLNFNRPFRVNNCSCFKRSTKSWRINY